MNPRPPLPPFTEETAIRKVQAAEDAWNSRDPERVSLAYTDDTVRLARAEKVDVFNVGFLGAMFDDEMVELLRKLQLRLPHC